MSLDNQSSHSDLLWGEGPCKERMGAPAAYHQKREELRILLVLYRYKLTNREKAKRGGISRYFIGDANSAIIELMCSL